MKENSSPAVAVPIASKRQALLQLAERCEREGPSFELGYAIHRAFAGPGDLAQVIYPYTTSHDAAVRLVPAGWSWTASNTIGMAFVWFGPHRKPTTEFYVLSAKTTALALCAAALRAHAALLAEPQHGVSP